MDRVMARFRPRNTFRLVSHLREGHREPVPAWKREELGLSRDLHERWTTLHRHCGDQSHLRLARLVRRLNDILADLNTELDLDVVLDRITAALIELTGADAGGFVRIEGEGPSVADAASLGR